MDRGDVALSRFAVGEPKLKDSGMALWLFPLLFLLVFFFLPMASIMAVMFSRADSIDLGQIWRPLGFTVGQAVLSTLLTLVTGLPAAFVFSRFHFPGKSFMRTLTMLPFILPTVVTAAGFNALLGPRGWINLALMDLLETSIPPVTFLNTFTAILVAHIFYNIAIVIRVVGSAWAQLDPRLEQSAQVLGASPSRSFIEVTLPLLKRPILASALLVFLFDFTSFGVVLMLGGPSFATLEVSIYTQALSLLNLRMAGILTLLQLACTIGITIFYSKVSSNQSIPLFPRLQGEGTQLPRTWMQKVIVLIVMLFLFLLQVLPLGALAARSIARMEADRGERGDVQAGVTLDFYQELFINRQQSYFYVPPVRAMINSLFYAGVTMVISTMAGTMLAYAFVRKPAIKRWLDALIMLPFGASAVTLGLGFIVTFNRPPIEAGTFPLLVPIAHSLIAMPFVMRTVQPAISSIPESLRESAAVLGASPQKVWWHVEMPIIRRALIAGAIFSFTISLGEFGATSFISSPKNPTLPIAIYRYLSQPGAMNYGQAMAMATILIIVCGVSVWLLEKLQSEKRAGV
ncbi:MAG: iron ABC transporter permease [Anaerolineaceae bacterium]|nr:iron ABC transporter permease [Anaerolineaceae bacterium]